MIHSSYAEIFAIQALELKPAFRTTGASETDGSDSRAAETSEKPGLNETLAQDIRLACQGLGEVSVVIEPGIGPVFTAEGLVLPATHLDGGQKKRLWQVCCEQHNGN